MIKLTKPTILLFSSTVLFLHTMAQTATVDANVDRFTITIGQPILLTLSANALTKEDKIIDWFTLGDSAAKHFEINNQDKIDTLFNNDNNSYTLQQKFTITSYDIGEWGLPPIFVNIKHQNSTTVQKLQALILGKIKVLPVDVRNTPAPNEVTDIIPIEEQNDVDIFHIGIIVTSVVFAAIVVFLVIRRKRKPVNKHKSNPFETATNRLKVLEPYKFSTKQQEKEFYHKLYFLFRDYYTTAYNDPSVENYTTTEWIRLLKTKNLPTDLFEHSKNFLMLADTIRFGDYDGMNDTRQTIVEVKKLIEALENFIKLP